jgi:hypothetical protein
MNSNFLKYENLVYWSAPRLIVRYKLVPVFLIRHVKKVSKEIGSRVTATKCCIVRCLCYSVFEIELPFGPELGRQEV